MYGWVKKEKSDSLAKNLGESFPFAVLLEECLIAIYLVCTEILKHLEKKQVLVSNLIRIGIDRNAMRNLVLRKSVD